ncbi:Fumarylacetoacetate hydrolase domain-containing protein 2 [Cladobotryum mycophilum]|uniref:Fumarylacetoacetate hydrolase domain-containing protein 2 n=1 Tax=Cladobotryum mycophilum TaxID=491253 RepID=A0ABR0SCR0_9HYPO
MPVPVPWVRLIRFEAEEDGVIHYGEPIFTEKDFDLGRSSNSQPIKAKRIHGDPLDPSCTVTNHHLTVRRLLAPLARNAISAVRCIGGNYSTHLNELGFKPARFPVMFPKFPNSIVGPGDSIEIPQIAQDDQADYEGEFVVIIGKDAKNVAKEDAWDYIVGYTVGNDVSARKWQQDPDLYLSDPHNLRLRTWVNGTLRQDSNTSHMIFKIPSIIQFCSQGSTLSAGDVILTGTPGGPGFMMSPPQWLRPGDRVEIEIENIGTLVNTVSYA